MSVEAKEKILLNGKELTPELIAHILAHPDSVELAIAPAARKKMEASRAFVLDIVAKQKPVYGINTGFGALSSQYIPSEQLSELQYNLIRSHCTGVGEPFDLDTAKVIMLIRANCLVQGYSGVTPEIVELLVAMINHQIIPVIYQQGSVGASGDLAPLSHLALALIGEGEVFYRGQRCSSADALKAASLTPAQLGPKDGLALINGTAVMSALAVTALLKAENLARTADLASALTSEATRGTNRAYHELISSVRPHRPQQLVAKNLMALTTDSEIRSSHIACGKVQDAYSLRCIPQVHGACRQTIAHLRDVLSIELNSVTDNPLIFVEAQEVISGGNFHGAPIAMAMDYMAIGLTDLCSISERRVEKMMNPSFSDLPAFLVKNSGLNSGLMIAHVTHAALTSENKVYAHPASVDSIPTSTDKEDHVSMGVTAGRKLHLILKNLSHCLAIEFLCNTQGIDLLRPLKSNAAIEVVHQTVRAVVPPIVNDRVFHHDIVAIERLIDSGALLRSLAQKAGIELA